MSVQKIMTFKPCYEDFKDFNKYIKFMESQGAHLAGVAKVIPPPQWKPRSQTYDMTVIGDIEIPSPISQVLQGANGVYEHSCSTRNSMSVRQLKEIAESDDYCKDRPPLGENDRVVSAYWDKVTTSGADQRIYGADVNGSLMDVTLEAWNISKLGSILEEVSEDNNINIEGVNTAYLYFGSWKTTFAWHVEDMDLYSINYLHFGAPKTWYAIPPSYGRRFERVAAGYFPEDSKSCNAFLRHKTAVISPGVLQSHGIPVDSITQKVGEFMITFPYGYHAGFNQGFNCAEATNFASERWIEYGKRCVHCSCTIGSVKFSMDAFVRRFQNDKYENWRNGQDIGEHPEVPGEKVLANLPDGFGKTTPKNGKKIKKTVVPLSFPELADDDGLDLLEGDDSKESNKMEILDATLLKMTKTRLSQLRMQESNFQKRTVKSIAIAYRFYARTEERNPENLPKSLRNMVLEEFCNYLKTELSWSDKNFNLRLAMFRRLVNSQTLKVDLTAILQSCKSKIKLDNCLLKLLNVLVDKAPNVEELTIGANNKMEDVRVTEGMMTKLAKLCKLKSLKISSIFKFDYFFNLGSMCHAMPDLQVISASVKGPATSLSSVQILHLEKCFPSLIVHCIKSSHFEPWLKELDERCRRNAEKLEKVYQDESKIFNWESNLMDVKLSRHTIYAGSPGKFRRISIEVEERSKQKHVGNKYHRYCKVNCWEHLTDRLVPVDQLTESQDASRFNIIHFVDGGESFPETMKVNPASCWPNVHTFTMESVYEMAYLEVELSVIAERCPNLERLIIKEMFNVYIVKDPALNALKLSSLRVLDLVVQPHHRTILPSLILSVAPNLEKVRLEGTAQFFTTEDLKVVTSMIADGLILRKLQTLHIALRAVSMVDEHGETWSNDHIPEENIKQVIKLLKTASAFLPRLTAIKHASLDSCGWKILASTRKTCRGKKRKYDSIYERHSFYGFLDAYRYS